jgi:hypothetical protein
MRVPQNSAWIPMSHLYVPITRRYKHENSY